MGERRSRYRKNCRICIAILAEPENRKFYRCRSSARSPTVDVGERRAVNRKHLLLCVSLSLAGCYDGTTMAGGDTDSGTAGEEQEKMLD